VKIKTRILSGLAAVTLALGMTMVGTGSANAASGSIINCFDYGGVTRGCSYFDPNSMDFWACDYFADNPPRYTKGRVSVDGVFQGEWDIWVDNTCSPTAYIPEAHPGALVCIRTGIEGLGWKQPSCRTI